MAESFDEGLRGVVDSISRRKASWAVTTSPAGSGAAASLVAGSFRVTRVTKSGQDGVVVSMGLSREQLQALRDACQELLGD